MRSLPLGFFVLAAAGCITAGRAADPAPYSGAACGAAVEDFFRDEVWTKVAARKCLTCHKTGGDAAESRLVLRDPQRAADAAGREAALRHNRDAFTRIARLTEGERSRLLRKVVGELDHGGEAVLPADSTEYRILAEFAGRAAGPGSTSGRSATSSPSQAPAVPFFAGVPMLDDRRLLRRALLSLVGRLPTNEEYAALESGGRAALGPILDLVLKEEAFYVRLREAFNDIFLTLGVDGNPDQSVLSYEHFSTTRQWYQKHDLTHIKDENERRRAGYKLADDYRKAILGEPMKLVEYIVRSDRPFTELVTADYILVSPYSARGYGVYDEVKAKFKNPDDPLEYVPVRLKALVGRNKADDQESATGYYPHAGLLSTFQWLRRYPTTETNRNRLRSRMYYQQFLGIDALELAARVADAAAVTAKFEIPTMQAAECVVCHKTLDPVAGLFQDFYRFEGVYGRRKEGWYVDMFAAGFEGEDLPPAERWRSLQWLGERTAKDPRFAATMVEHVYYVLTGRRVLLPPKDPDDPLYASRRRAYDEQRRTIDAIAMRFAREGFNLKQVFKDWIASDFYRVDAGAAASSDVARRTEWDDVGLVRLLAPEQVERKLGAVFGEPWGRLTDQLAMLYGGIDSKEVTERATDPSGAMGAIQRILANDVACKQTLRDFARPAAERRLFPDVEPTDLPDGSPAVEARLRRAIVHLHDLVLGRDDAPDSEAVDRTLDLFRGIVQDAAMTKGLDQRESYYCRTHVHDAPDDPHYTIRAWRGVLTYLLRRPEFLYE